MRDWPLKTEQRMNEPNVQGASISVEANEGDVVLEDTLISYKAYVDKTLWMMQAFLGKEAYEDDDAMEEDED